MTEEIQSSVNAGGCEAVRATPSMRDSRRDGKNSATPEKPSDPQTTLRVTEVTPLHGERIDFEYHDSHIRYSADSWVWCVGESTETIFDCEKLEEAYQLWKSKQ
jgi:hypothetical protein